MLNIPNDTQAPNGNTSTDCSYNDEPNCNPIADLDYNSMPSNKPDLHLSYNHVPKQNGNTPVPCDCNHTAPRVPIKVNLQQSVSRIINTETKIMQQTLSVVENAQTEATQEQMLAFNQSAKKVLREIIKSQMRTCTKQQPTGELIFACKQEELTGETVAEKDRCQ